MTAQIKDQFILDEVEYSIIGYTKDIPFNLQYFNLNPQMSTTACWRGFQRFFTIANSKLYILNLEVNDGGAIESPEDASIHDVKPILINDKNSYFNQRYENIYHHIPYTGSVIIGASFIVNCTPYGRLPDFWCYQNVIHLTFNDGALESNSDISSIMKTIRETKETERDESIKAIIVSLDKNYNRIE